MILNNNKYGKLTIGSSHIGNIRDINIRMKDELLSNDLIVAANMNDYNDMCNYFNINPLAEVFIHSNELGNNEEAWQKANEYLTNGKNVLIISSRGMPNIADMGPTITRRAEFGLKVMPRVIPGPSIASAAIAAVGFDTTSFTFLQSLPRSKEMRFDFLEKLKFEDRTFMFLNKNPADTKEIIQEIFDCFKNFKKVLIGILINLTEENENVIVGTHFEVIQYLQNPDIKFNHNDKVTIIVQNYENFDKNLQIHREHF